MFCKLKKREYVQLMFQKLTEIVKNNFFLMIPNNEWHYPAVKTLPALLRGINSKNNGDFYCLSYLHSFKT